MKEIERKFLVTSDAYKEESIRKTRIVQGYLSSVPERTVRIRIYGDKGYITIKGVGDITGVSRFEWEKDIPIQDAEVLLTLCEPGKIDKWRYEVPAGQYTFEVDEFDGDNKGLTIAEIELDKAEALFNRPAWLGKEVTGDTKYYNASLIKQPYSTWQEHAILNH